MRLLKFTKSSQVRAAKQFKPADMVDYPAKGRKIYIEAVVDEIRGSRIICANKAGYYYTVSSGEIYIRQKACWIRQGKKYVCPECGHKEKHPKKFCEDCGSEMEVGSSEWKMSAEEALELARRIKRTEEAMERKMKEVSNKERGGVGR